MNDVECEECGRDFTPTPKVSVCCECHAELIAERDQLRKRVLDLKVALLKTITSVRRLLLEWHSGQSLDNSLVELDETCGTMERAMSMEQR